MKKVLVFFTVIILNVYIIPQTTVQYGIFTGGNSILTIRIQAGAGANYTTLDQISTLVFTVSWPTSAGSVTLGTPSGAYSVAKIGAPGIVNSNNYQIFNCNGGAAFNLPEPWSSNGNYLIATIPIIGGGIDQNVSFELARDDFIGGADVTDALLSINGFNQLNSIKFFNFSIIATLPVELTSFTASVNFNIVYLKWKTATETNNYGFEIERSLTESASGGQTKGEGLNNWEKIGFVNGHGNSNSPKDYNFTDGSVKTGKFIYRLKQIDMDGKYEYSDVVEVDLGYPKNYSLGQNYPNPFNPTTRIDYQLPFDSKVTIELYSIAGEKVATLINKELSAGYYNTDINAGALNLSSGVYLYRISAISQAANAQAFVQVKKLMLMK